MSEGLGSKGANQALTAARAGAALTLWTAVGADAAAKALADLRAALEKKHS